MDKFNLAKNAKGIRHKYADNCRVGIYPSTRGWGTIFLVFWRFYKEDIKTECIASQFTTGHYQRKRGIHRTVICLNFEALKGLFKVISDLFINALLNGDNNG